VFKLPGNLSLEKADQSDKKFRIKGIMSAPIVDAENEVLTSASYPSIIDKVKTRANIGDFIPVVIEHRRSESLPVGYIEDAYEQDGKLGFTAVIANGGPGSLPDTVQQLISQNVLRHVSIGGDINQNNEKAAQMVYDSNKKKYVRHINDAVIRELSLTGLPVNEEATFSLAKSLNMDAKNVRSLMKKLDKALAKELIGKKINKAINESDLGAIEDALKNLADVLKEQFNVEIDIDAITSEQKDELGASTTNEVSKEVKNPSEENTPSEKEITIEEDADTEENSDKEEEVSTEEDTGVEENEENENEVVIDENDEIEEETEKAIEEVDESTVEKKLDKLIELISGLGKNKKENSKVDEEIEDKEIEMEKSIKNSNNKEGGEKEMEKRLICKSCGEDFSYGSDESIEKSFKFCPVCSKPLTKALIDNELNKVYFIESVADAVKVENETDKNAVIKPEGHPSKEATLSGTEGEIDSVGEEAAKNAVIKPEGHPVKESTSGPQNLISKSEEAITVEKSEAITENTSVEKNMPPKDVTINDKVQGNRLDDFSGEKVPYAKENKTDAYQVVKEGVKQDVFKRAEYQTTYNAEQGSVDQKIQKSIEPIKATLEAIQKSLEAPENISGRKALFLNTKIVKSMPSREDLDTKVFLNALFNK
jgi:hypothetical protein